MTKRTAKDFITLALYENPHLEGVDPRALQRIGELTVALQAERIRHAETGKLARRLAGRYNRAKAAT